MPFNLSITTHDNAQTHSVHQMHPELLFLSSSCIKSFFCVFGLKWWRLIEQGYSGNHTLRTKENDGPLSFRETTALQVKASVRAVSSAILVRKARKTHH